jgi:hypothetical protein
LIKTLRKAYSVGAEIPEFHSSFNDGNATIFIKINVIDPIDKKANDSDFPLQYDYEYADGGVLK